MRKRDNYRRNRNTDWQYRRPSKVRPSWLPFSIPAALLGTFGAVAYNMAGGGTAPVASVEPAGGASSDTFTCSSPTVVDGDTLRCGTTRVRLQGIDAPEMPGHCRQGRECTPGDPYASADNLRRLVSGGTMSCRQTDTDHYGRVVAICEVGGNNLSCEQVRSGNAVRRYAPLSC